MSRAICSLLLLALAGCIDQSSDSPASEGEVTDGGAATDGVAAGEDGDRPPLVAPDMGERPPVKADAGGEPVDSAGAPDAALPENLCDAYCAKVEACLVPECPALAGNADQVCRPSCRQPDAVLREAIAQPCDAFVADLFERAPPLRDFCSDAPPPPECQEICRRASDCGVPGGPDACGALCRSLDPAQRQCMSDAGGCDELLRCLQGGPRQPPAEQICGPFCNQQIQCVTALCAAGTLAGDFAPTCRDECRAAPPTREEAAWVLDAHCPDVVAGVRARHEDIDDRCDNDPDEACAVVCADTVVPCDALDDADCRAACADWDQANQLCLQGARDCDAVATCFGDSEGQARCERYCSRVQGCLEEACPPRIIPPSLSVGCTAGCLDDPPSDEVVAEWEGLTCAEVRRQIYRQNRQLRPVCEGRGDFRPSPEECADFCDNALAACLGVGGRGFCLAGCASLTREQYACALEAQGDCERIAVCLGPAQK